MIKSIFINVQWNAECHICRSRISLVVKNFHSFRNGNCIRYMLTVPHHSSVITLAQSLCLYRSFVLRPSPPITLNKTAHRIFIELDCVNYAANPNRKCSTWKSASIIRIHLLPNFGKSSFYWWSSNNSRGFVQLVRFYTGY